MKGVQILGQRGLDAHVTLTTTLAQPTPTGNELLIRVHSAGITGDELSWTEVYKPSNLRIPGHDISGTITALGPEYSGPFRVGDAVFAMLAAERGMGQAEYAIAKPDEVARKPVALSHAQAAALPIPVLTAWEALFRHAGEHLKNGGEGKRILVTGASGAVGLVLVQIAKKVLGTQVVALASQGKHALLKKMGTDEVVDYKLADWETQLEKVDLVFDMAGGEVLTKSWRVVKEKGCVVTVADPPPRWALEKDVVPEELAFAPGVRYVYFVLSTDADALGRVGELIDKGEVKPLPVVEYPADQAVEAWAAARQRNREGKVVINFVTETA